MLAAEVVAGLAAAVAAFVIDPVSGSDDILLIVLFLALAILSDAFTIVTGRGFDVSGSLLATVLAIALTGPVGGVLVGTVSALVDGVRNRRPVPSTVANVAAWSTFKPDSSSPASAGRKSACSAEKASAIASFSSGRPTGASVFLARA